MRSKHFVVTGAWLPTPFPSNSPWLWTWKTLSFQGQLYKEWTHSNLFSFSCANILIVRQQLPVSGWLHSSKYTAEQLSAFTCTLADLRGGGLSHRNNYGCSVLPYCGLGKIGSWNWLWVKWAVAWLFLTEKYLDVLFFKTRFTLNAILWSFVEWSLSSWEQGPPCSV